MEEIASEEKDNKEKQEEVSEQESPSEAPVSEVAVPVAQEEDDEEEDDFSMEELETEINRLRAKVTKLKSVLWQLGYDSEGKRRI